MQVFTIAPAGMKPLWVTLFRPNDPDAFMSALRALGSR